MELLRAKARVAGGWWELCLLDLDVMVEGKDEADMLRQLEHTLICEYELATKFGQVPFKRLLLAIPTDVYRAWQEGDKNFRKLDLPQEVRDALAHVFSLAVVPEFGVEPPSKKPAA